MMVEEIEFLFGTLNLKSPWKLQEVMPSVHSVTPLSTELCVRAPEILDHTDA